MFEVVADRLDERRAHMAVDHAMVERARHVHHLSNRNLVVPDDRAFLDLVDAQDRDLGPIDDRRREDAPFLAERCDREGGALDLLEGEFLVPCGSGKPLEFLREVPQALFVGVVDDRDREALVRGGRDSNVVVSLDHDLSSLVVDGRIPGREFHEGREDCLYEEGQEGELYSLAGLGGVPGSAHVARGAGGATALAGRGGGACGLAAPGRVGTASPASPNTTRVLPTFTTSPSFARS